MADDPIADILRSAQLSNRQRAALWDIYYDAPDADALASRLQGVSGVPDEIKATLWDLKAAAAPVEAPTTTSLPEAEPERGWLDTAKDVAIGAAKSVPDAVFGLGKVFRDYTPVGYISDAIQPGAFDQKPPEIVPTNTAQEGGMLAGQIAQFFVPGPTGATRLLRAGGEAVKSGVLTAGQTGGDPAAAATSAGLSAVVPAAGAVTRASRGLRAGAEKSMAQALGATKESMKVDAARLAPEMLRRGVRGSRGAMLARAGDMADRAGKGIDEAVKAAAARGVTVDGRAAIDGIARTREGFIVNGAPIEGTQRIVKRLDKLEAFVSQLGPDIPVDQAQRIKQTWDRIVSKAGLYSNKASASATDSADAWAIREGAGAFRRLLAEATPDLDRLNKDFRFWGGLRDVLDETVKRTQSQGGGLVSNMGGIGGASAMAAGGGDFSDIAMAGFAGQKVIRVMQSPWWRTSVSAPLKNLLADALASGNAERIERAARKIVNALPAQAQMAMAQ